MRLITINLLTYYEILNYFNYYELLLITINYR